MRTNILTVIIIIFSILVLAYNHGHHDNHAHNNNKLNYGNHSNKNYDSIEINSTIENLDVKEINHNNCNKNQGNHNCDKNANTINHLESGLHKHEHNQKHINDPLYNKDIKQTHDTINNCHEDHDYDHDHNNHDHFHDTDSSECTATHQHSHSHSHSHNYYINYYQNKLNIFLDENLKPYDNVTQGYLGAAFVSIIPIPIFILIILLRLNNKFILEILTAFSAGSLLGDVIFHNFSEIFANNSNHKEIDLGDENLNQYVTKEMFICYGLILIFTFDKLLPNSGHSHSHNDNDKVCTKNKTFDNEVLIAFFNDFTHNLTDGITIAVSFKISFNLGISNLIALTFHEIPHEVADFSFLLKRKSGVFTALLNQILAALGAFVGVYLSKIKYL